MFLLLPPSSLYSPSLHVKSSLCSLPPSWTGQDVPDSEAQWYAPLNLRIGYTDFTTTLQGG